MIEQVLITSFIIWAFYALTRVKFSPIENKFTEKAPLWFIKWYGDQYLHPDIQNLIYDCGKCMAWLWTIGLSFYFGFTWSTPLIALAVCGLNYVLIRLYPYSE